VSVQQEIYQPSFGKITTFFAKIISYIFHPLFIPTYIFWLLVKFFPYDFPGITDKVLGLKIFSVFWMTAFFPALAVFLLWRLKFISNIYLHTQKERIIPFFITMFFYWWMYYLSRNFTDQPQVLKFFYFGIFISTAIGVIINNYIKISLHGIAMGSALMAVILFAFYYQVNLGLLISIVTLLTGIVATSRFIAGKHTNAEMYIGIFTGIICQLFGYWFVM
jgi:hypothetical protein